MKFLKYFLILFFLSGIFHHPLLESFTRSKRFFSSYFKKPTFNKNFFSKFFTKTRQKFRQFRTKFSFRPFTKFKKYAQKPVVKKVTKLTTAAAASMTLKSFIEKAFADEKENIEKSLSYKFAQKKTIEELQEFFNTIGAGWIKDPLFAWQQIIKALKREQIAQKRKDFVGYHTTSTEILLALVLYTELYNEKNNIENKEDFIYLRTFESVKETKNILPLKFLETFFEQKKEFNEQIPWSNKNTPKHLTESLIEKFSDSRAYLFSLSPWLFQLPDYSKEAWTESALTMLKTQKEEKSDVIRQVNRIKAKQNETRIKQITVDLCKTYNISDNSLVFLIDGLINRYTEKLDKYALLQIIFDNKQTTTLDNLKQQVDIKNSKLKFPINPALLYVGYDENNVFPNLYWANTWGRVCYNPEKKLSSEADAYDGPQLYKEMLYGKDIPKNAENGQVRAVITEDILSKRNVKYEIVDLDNSFGNYQNIKKELIEEAKAIIRLYQQPTSIKTPEKQTNQ